MPIGFIPSRLGHSQGRGGAEQRGARVALGRSAAAAAPASKKIRKRIDLGGCFCWLKPMEKARAPLLPEFLHVKLCGKTAFVVNQRCMRLFAHPLKQ